MQQAAAVCHGLRRPRRCASDARRRRVVSPGRVPQPVVFTRAETAVGQFDGNQNDVLKFRTVPGGPFDQ